MKHDVTARPWAFSGLAALITVSYLALLPFTTESTDVKPLVAAWGALLLLGAALWGSWRSQRARRLVPLSGILGVLVALHALALPFAVNVGFAWSELARWITLYALFWAAAWTCRDTQRFWRLAMVCTVCMGLASVYGLCQRYGLDPFPWNDYEGLLKGAPATFGNPNFASHVLVLTAILAAGRLAMRAWWIAPFLALFATHFMLTRTRGSLIALVAAAVFALALPLVRRHARTPRRAMAAIATAGGTALLLAVAALCTASYYRTGVLVPLDESSVLRAHSFAGAARMVADRPLLGRGPGGYYIESPHYWSSLEQERFSTLRKLNDHVHNETLEFAVETGVLGGAAYLAFFLFGTFYALNLALTAADRSTRRMGYTMAAFYVAAWVDGQFGFNLRVPVSAALVFIMSGAMAGVIDAERGPLPSRPWRPWTGAIWRLAVTAALVAVTWTATSRFMASVHQQRGLAAIAFNAPQAAYAELAKARDRAPYDWRIRYAYARACLLANRPEEAKTEFQETLRDNPTYLGAYCRLAQQLTNEVGASTGEKADRAAAEARALVEKALHLAPAYPDAEDVLGRLALLEADRKLRAGVDASTVEPLCREGEAHLRLALRGQEKTAPTYRLIAQSAFSRQDSRAAYHALAEALRADPADATTWNVVAAVAREPEGHDFLLGAIEAFSPELERDPAAATVPARLYALRAKAALDGPARSDLAAADYRLAVCAAPAQFALWEEFHRFALTHGQRPEFVSAWQVARERLFAEAPTVAPLFPVVTPAIAGDAAALASISAELDRQAESLARTKQPGEAQVAALKWVTGLIATELEFSRLEPNETAKSAMRVGTALAGLGDVARGESLLMAAFPLLKETSDAATCAKRLAKLSADRPRRAQAVLRQALERAPNDPELRWLFGDACAAAGDATGARAAYEQVLKTPGLSAEARRRLEKALAGLGKPR